MRTLICLIIVTPVLLILGIFAAAFVRCAFGILRDYNNSFKDEHIDVDGNVHYYNREDSD